jgi:nicotinamidase-related amidase
MDCFGPAPTALLVVHLAGGMAGQVDTPFNPLFRERAEKTGIIRVQTRLLEGFRRAKAKVIYTLVTYQPGLPGVRPNSPLLRTLVGSPTLLQGTPAVEVIDDIAPQPDEPVVRGQAANGLDGTALDTILRVAGVDTLVLIGIATDVAIEYTARCMRPAIPDDRRIRCVPGRQRRSPHPRATSSKSGSARLPPQRKSSAPWRELPPIQLTEPHELELPEQCMFGQNGYKAASSTENEQ